MSDEIWNDDHNRPPPIYFLVDTDIRNERMEICKRCTNLVAYFCKECHCFMPSKTWIKQASCPTHLWESEQ